MSQTKPAIKSPTSITAFNVGIVLGVIIGGVGGYSHWLSADTMARRDERHRCITIGQIKR